MSEQINIDSIITNLEFANFLKSIGGIYLKRISVDRPCSDTFSISRLGDTVKSTNYLWMKLKLNHDTNHIAIAYILNTIYKQYIDIASLNFIYKLHATPNDQYFSNQLGLTSLYTNAVKAWDYLVGNSVRIGIIDDGADIEHCDLGYMGNNYNVRFKGGRNFTSNSTAFRTNSFHGTGIAGIIGANLNKECILNPSETGIAGITGGWWPNYVGSHLFGYKTSVSTQNNNILSTEYVIQAIRKAAPGTILHWNNYVHILNFSAGLTDVFDLPLFNAILYAYRNNVNFVTSRGNDNQNISIYPACYEDRIVTSVGGSDIFNSKFYRSNFGKQMDFLAPASSDLIYTTKYNGGYESVEGTSASAAFVSGFYGLLKNISLGNQEYFRDCEPEDYEGVMQASTKITNVSYGNNDGWGVIDVGIAFNRIKEENYYLKHYSIKDNLTFGPWSNAFDQNFIKAEDIGILPTDKYRVEVREITYDFQIDPNEWELYNNNSKLFAWSRGDRERSGGYSIANPNYQLSYTSLINGFGGNGITEGINFTNTPIIKLKTYQYRMVGNLQNASIFIPPTENIKLNFSIWGKKKGSTNVEFSKETKSIIKTIQIDKSYLLICFDQINTKDVKMTYKLYNLLGEIQNINMIETENQVSFDIMSLPKGIYFISIANGEYIEAVKVTL